MTDFPRTNWSKSYSYQFRNCIRPTSIDELGAAVRVASKIKALGSGHSFNAIADGDVAVVLNGIPLAPAIEDDGRRVSIAGHATYGDLARFLQEHGLAVHNLASLPHISIAGAIATATHGSGNRNGNLATAVCGLEFVTGDGEVVRVERTDPDFEGMVVHLGALGVVTRVTLAVQPAFQIRQNVYEGLSWTTLFENFDEICAAGYSVSVFTGWGDEAGQVWVKAMAGEDVHAICGTTPATVKRHPIIGLDPVNATDQLGEPGLWSDRLSHFRMGFMPSSGEEIQSEFHVPRRHATAALEALVAIRRDFSHLILAGEFRTVAADRLWMSPQYQRDTLSIHFTWRREAAAVDQAVARIEAALAPFEALPHWGKVFSERNLSEHYPMAPAFKKLRDRMDPEGKFRNEWLDRIVG